MSENLHASASETFEGSGKAFLTNSMIDLFCRCPHAFYLRYVKGLKKPPGVQLLRGRSVHHAGDVNFKQKIESHVDMKTNDIIDCAVARFDDYLDNDEIGYSQEEVSRGLKIIHGEVRDEVAAHADVMANEQAPRYQPLSVEQSIEMELDDREFNVRGTLDLRSIDPVDVGTDNPPETLTDFKTAGKKKSQSDADQSTQLSLYSCLYRYEHGRFPDRLELSTSVVTKTKAYSDIHETTRAEAHYKALTARFDVIWECMKTGNFAPASPTAWWCSRRWCGFYDDCRYVV